MNFCTRKNQPNIPAILVSSKIRKLLYGRGFFFLSRASKQADSASFQSSRGAALGNQVPQGEVVDDVLDLLDL